MTVEVIIRNSDAGDIMDIVKKLRADGLVQGQDFDFAFYRKHWDPMTGDIESTTKFTFYTDKYATMFSLRYGS